MSRPKQFPKNILIPASPLDVMEWLEQRGKQTSLSSDGEYFVYLRLRGGELPSDFIGLYAPSLVPFKITFSGHAIPIQFGSKVQWPDDSQPRDYWAKVLLGQFILTIKQLEGRFCLISPKIQDAEPLFVERAAKLLEDLVGYYEEQRISSAQRPVQEPQAVDHSEEQSLLLDEPAFSVTLEPVITAPILLQDPEIPAEPKATERPPKKKRRGGRRSQPMEVIREIVERWRKVEGTMSQFQFANTCDISERTLRNYIKKVEVEEEGSD